MGLHVGSEMYDVEGFKKGRSSLSDIEVSELGPLIHEGTTLLHLQCHFGLDTLSWARRGAVVTGVDFSGEGIATARGLADEVGLSARATFVQSDVLALPDVLQGSFDVVFTSWGALIWIGDLERWAQVVAHFLKPGGTFYIAEFHPYAFLLADDSSSDSLRIGYPYFQYGRPQRFDEPGDYADPEARTRAHRHLRVEPRLRRDPRPPAAQAACASSSSTSSRTRSSACRSPSSRSAKTACSA